MKVHLLRSKELHVYRYSQIVRLLQKHKGPIEFLSTEPLMEEEDIVMEPFLTLEDHIDQKFIPPENGREVIKFISACFVAIIIAVFYIPIESVSRKITSYIRQYRSVRSVNKEASRKREKRLLQCEKYRRENFVDDNDLVILVTDIRDPLNWFIGHSAKSHVNNFFVVHDGPIEINGFFTNILLS